MAESSLLVSKRGGYKIEGDRLSRACGDRTKENGFKLKERRLDIRKEAFYNKDDEAVAQVAQKMVDAPPLETFKV